MIAGSSLTIEIGSRVLLRDASFTVGTGEKVGLVGRNGTGKSTLVSAVLGVPAAGVRVSGNARTRGTVGFLPQVPAPEGLGLDSTGFSHVLSARGLDVLDDGLTRARQAMEKDPTADAIERFSDFEEQFRENGGYEVEGVIARLSDGLGLRQDLLLEDIADLSGGQRRRLDLVRVLFQQPEIMVLDEPTNHLDLGAKKWLMDELERFNGALLVISHDIKLLDQAITKVLHLADASLREYKGTYTSYRAQLAADQAQRERSATLEGREIARLTTLADSMRGSTVRRARIARSLDTRVGRLESARTVVDKRERTTKFTLPEPRRSAATPLTVVPPGRVLRGGPRTQERLLLPRPGRPGGGHRPQRRRQVEPAALPGRGPDPERRARWSWASTWLSATSPRNTSRSIRHCTTLDNIDDTILKSITERRALLGFFRAVGQARRPDAGHLVRVANGPNWVWPCWPPVRPTSSSSTNPPTTSTRHPPWPWGRC